MYIEGTPIGRSYSNAAIAMALSGIALGNDLARVKHLLDSVHGLQESEINDLLVWALGSIGERVKVFRDELLKTL